MFGSEKGCEGLQELWKRVKLPQESDMVRCSQSYRLGAEISKGMPLPADHHLYATEPIFAVGFPYSNSPNPSEPNSLAGSRRPSSPSLQHLALDDRSIPLPIPLRAPSPSVNRFGPGYAQLPNHGEDMRRLMEECTAARESARVLSEAVIFTRPEDLERKPIIRVSLRLHH